MQSRPAATLSMMLAPAVLMGLALVALGRASSTQAQAQDDDPLPTLSRDQVYALDALLERVLQDFAIPGLAIGIVENGEPAYLRGFGVRDLRSDRPVNTHTLFHISSLTRTFTATAVMQLAERGQLGLSDTIADSPVTAMQLLTRDDAAFNALGGIVESASQQPYLHYLQSNVLDAAGLTESSFDMPLADSNVAWPHTGKVFVRPAEQYPWKQEALPSAGLNASIGDVTRWAALQVNRDPALLTAASYDTMLKHQRDGERGARHALGWQLERHGEQWLPVQAASEQGFSAFVTLYPAQRRAIVVLANGETAPGKQIRDVIESVLGGAGYVVPTPPLLRRADFRWAVGGLLGSLLLLIATRVHRRRQPAT